MSRSISALNVGLFDGPPMMTMYGAAIRTQPAMNTSPA